MSRYVAQPLSVNLTVTSLMKDKFVTRISPVTTKFSHAMFSKQTFWLWTRFIKLSVSSVGRTKHGNRHFTRLLGKFPLISQWLFLAPTTEHRLSSLLHGVMILTNSSLSPTRSAKQTFFAGEVGLVGPEPFPSFFIALQLSKRSLIAGAVVRVNSDRWRQLRNLTIEVERNFPQ